MNAYHILGTLLFLIAGIVLILINAMEPFDIEIGDDEEETHL